MIFYHSHASVGIAIRKIAPSYRKDRRMLLRRRQMANATLHRRSISFWVLETIDISSINITLQFL